MRCRYCFASVRDGDGPPKSRCRRCRQPLYERQRIPEHVEEGTTGRSICAVHRHNAAIGTCSRCGNYTCDYCWTRWQGRSICVACVDRAMESKETVPEESRAHLRQAVLALLFGLAGWGSIILSFIIILIGAESKELLLVGLGGLLFLGSPLLGVFGLGQGAAAVRARGNHMILGTFGLVLSAVQVGVPLGLLAVGIWKT